MPHRERHQWVEEISKINKKINKQQSAPSSAPSGVAGLNLDFR